MARRLLVIAFALLLAVQVVRTALVAALAPVKPQLAARAWPRHPDVELSRAMIAIGEAARDRKPVSAGVFEMVDDAAGKAPLAAEPYLVRGVQAQIGGKLGIARQAFLAAEWRDPRSLPARYFLANDFLRSGDARSGLREFAVLARLAPNGVTSVAPYIAAFAKDRANWPRLRALFRSDPELEDPALSALAADPGNADAILTLSDAEHRNAQSQWLQPLLGSLVDAGQYARARSIWAKVAGVRLEPGQLLFDAKFTDRASPPPFNWALTSSTVGLAERQAGGRLHVISYGQEEGELARQLLVLAPGTYRVSMGISGGQAGRLRWTLTCAGSHDPLAAISLDKLGSQPWTFTVPGGCPAQFLALVGTSSDIAQQSDVTISGLKAERVPSHG